MFAVAFSPLILTAAPAAADDSAAHAIAEKFSRAEEAERAAAERKKSEVKKKADAEKARAEAARRKAAADQRAKDEAEMLERARAEAEARQQEEERAAERLRAEAQRQAARAEAERLAREAELRRQEDERKAEEARQAEAQRLAKEVEEKRLAEERKAEEARIAREAEERRLTEEARRAEDARIAKEAEEKRLAEERRAARLAKEAEEARRAEAIRKAEEKRQADAAREALEKQRTEEAERVAEKFRQAHEARETKLARERDATARERGTDSRNSLGGPGPDTTTAPWDITDNGPARFLPTRATILLIMDPRRRVFAAYPPRANPVLCIGQGCYVSGGANAPAQYMPRWSALGPANSIGRRAGPCRNQLTCVFRDVELGGGYGQIQPVDMGLLHHDRREIRGVRPDPTCDLVGGRLFCAEPVVARGYRAWIVPELIATKAGSDALREALALGLPTARAAALDPWRGEVHAESSR